MLRITALALLISSIAFGQSAIAESRPPSDADSLSEILRKIEQEDGFARFSEIEWDDDGYWEIEYFTKDRVKVEIKVVPSKQAASAKTPTAEPAPVAGETPNPNWPQPEYPDGPPAGVDP